MSRPVEDVVFDWRLSRCHGELTRLIAGFTGVMQADGYEGYAAYARVHPSGLLTAYAEQGQTKLDNNLLENAIRSSAVGKKNWRFVGHPQAGKRVAVLYSIIISCQSATAKNPGLSARRARALAAHDQSGRPRHPHPQSLAAAIQRGSARIGYGAPVLIIVKFMRTPI